LKAIQKVLIDGPAAREDLEFMLGRSKATVLNRLKKLKKRGVVIMLPDKTYALAGLCDV
jgi:Mn-dependent DtxR family transcriptional regulator